MLSPTRPSVRPSRPPELDPPLPATRPAPPPGGTLWLTGLPSSGKTSVAVALAEVLRARGRPVEVLDGDEIRAALAGQLGFSPADRAAQVQRVGFLARLLARHGVLAVAPLVSPYATDRSALRAASQADGLAFVEVHVAAPVAVCSARDVKGLYAAQAAGRLTGLTGVDDPYEVPTEPDLVLPTHAEALPASVARVLALLADRGLAW